LGQGGTPHKFLNSYPASAVLDQGPLPLDLLETKINAWIAAQK
jgi:uncharacterized protein (DUF885 family)